MDKDLEKILERSKKNDPKPEPPKAPEKVFPKNGPYDYLVFTKLVRFAAFQNLIFLFMLPGMICIGFFFEEIRQETVYVLLIYAGLLIVYKVVNFLRYRFSFLGWQERLPFELKGWNEMIHEKKMFCDLCWNYTRIEVVLNESTPDMEALVAASLKLFSEQSKLAYYERDLARPSTMYRNDWKLISSTVAEGSVNPEVMRYMKDLFQNELSIIAKKTGKIKGVEVTLLSKEFEVAIAIYNGD